jgi:uncharacterized protein CbrC (UPF0167 family)
MSEPLPVFPYHPDPLGTRTIAASTTICACCGRARGYIYTGPVYASEELENSLCPWCIADGSAAERFHAVYTDDMPRPDDVPRDIIDAITRRTPGFRGWQQEHWLYHCRDGAAFLGVVGWPELQELPDALDSLRAECARLHHMSEEAEQYLCTLAKHGSPTAYLFQCRHCAAHLAYSDAD